MFRLAALLTLAAAGGCAAQQAPPGPAPAPDWSTVTRYLDSAVAAGAAPGAVLGVSVGCRHWFYGTGRLAQDDSTRPDSSTIYDLASLTKAIGLTTAVMLGVGDGRLALDTPVVRYVPAFRGASKAAVTLRHLLTHSSGLPAWRPLYLEARTRTEALALADTTPLDSPPGVRFAYSDLGAIVLTQAVEAVYGERLDSLLARRVFGPLGMTSTRFLPPPDWAPRIAPTEDDPWRGRVLRGEVQDENAARLDGVSGHAGLFSDAGDLLRFADWLLEEWAGGQADGHTAGSEYRSGRPSVPPSIVREFTRRQNLPPGSSRALGWDTPSDSSSAGTRLAPDSFGHTGFTGTSIWIDPYRRLVIVLLSNRVHPTRENQKWGPVRAAVADRVALTLFPDAR